MPPVTRQSGTKKTRIAALTTTGLSRFPFLYSLSITNTQ